MFLQFTESAVNITFPYDGGFDEGVQRFPFKVFHKISAAKPDVDAPITRPFTCKYNFLLNTKYVFWTHRHKDTNTANVRPTKNTQRKLSHA